MRYELDTYYSELNGYYFRIFDTYTQDHLSGEYEDEMEAIDDLDIMNENEELENYREFG